MRRAFTFVFAAVAVFAVTPRVSAHANLLGSQPSSGARLDASPGSVTLRFSEDPQVSLSEIQVLSSDGTRLDTGGTKAGAEPDTLRVAVRDLERGTYTVAWHCVSRVDGHATAGSFAFGVGVTPTAPAQSAPKSPPPNPLEVAGRIAFIAGVFVLFGGAIVALLAPAARSRLRTYITSGGAVAFVGTALIALAQQRGARASWGAVFATPIGRAVVYRAIALTVAAVSVLLSARAVSFGVAALAGVAAMYAEVSAGHAAAVTRLGGDAVHVAVQVAHFAAGAAWIGGLGAVLIAVRGTDPERTVKRYSTVAAISLATIGATGVYRAFGEIGSVDGLLHSSYGYAVIAKVVLFGALALLGARQRFVNLPAVGTSVRGLVRVGTRELAVAAAIVAATGLLTALSPPPSGAATDVVTATGSDFGRTARVRLEVTPAQAGVNTFTVRILEGFRPRSVRLRFEYAQGSSVPPSEAPLRRDGDGWRASVANLSLDGRWTITVLLQGRTTSAEVPLEIATRCVTETVPGGKGPVIHMQTLAGGASDQTYADPGRPGRNEIHFTFFDAKGDELAIQPPDITASRAGRSPHTLAVRRFSEGHFIASGRLSEGHWRFDALAKPKGTEGQLRACFEQDI
jgi:copper transport protein